MFQEFLIRRFHSLFVDFIYHLPFKLKELRVQAEDTARIIEDCERARKPFPDNLQRDYEYFLELVRTTSIRIFRKHFSFGFFFSFPRSIPMITWNYISVKNSGLLPML